MWVAFTAADALYRAVIQHHALAADKDKVFPDTVPSALSASIQFAWRNPRTVFRIALPYLGNLKDRDGGGTGLVHCSRKGEGGE